MTMFTTRGFALRALFGFATLAIALSAAPAHAQTRPALVRDVDNPALQPQRISIRTTLQANESSKFTDAYVVPAGKRLVIENASIWALTQGTDRVTGIWLSVKDGSAFIMLDPTSTETKTLSGGSNVTAYNRVVKAYFNAGETVEASVFTEGTTGVKLVNVYVQGHLITP